MDFSNRKVTECDKGRKFLCSLFLREKVFSRYGVIEIRLSNIVHLIRENYKKIPTTIRLSGKFPNNVVVKYKVTSHDDDECTGVGITVKIEFRITVGKSVPKGGGLNRLSWKPNLNIILVS